MVGKTPVFCASHAPYMAGIYNGEAGAAKNGWLPEPSENLDFLTDKKVFVFSGISGNAAFAATVAAFAGQVTGSMGFTDHHHYTASDFQQIIDRAQASGAAYLVTTEKDFVKIAGKMKSPLDIVVIGIRMAFDRDSDRVASVIREKVSQMIMLRKR
jgi:tetraacyldisaccharide 4'-kinase